MHPQRHAPDLAEPPHSSGDSVVRLCRSALAPHRERLAPPLEPRQASSCIVVRQFAHSVSVRPAARTHPLAVEAVLGALGRCDPPRPVVLDLREALLSDPMLEALRRALCGPDALLQAVSLVADRPFARKKLRAAAVGRNAPLFVSVVAALRGGREGVTLPSCPSVGR